MPLIVVCSAALVGLAIGNLARLDAPSVGIAAALALLGAVLARGQPGWRLGALVACAAAVGALRTTSATSATSAAASSFQQTNWSAVVEPYLGTSARLRATLAQTPILSASGTTLLFAVDVNAVAPAGRDPPPSAASSQSAVRLRVVADPLLADPLAQDAPSDGRAQQVAGARSDHVGSSTAAGIATATAAGTSPTTATAADAAAALPSAQAAAADVGPWRVPLASGDTVVLEGRLMRSDPGPGPPTLIFPRLLAYAAADDVSALRRIESPTSATYTATADPAARVGGPADPARRDAGTADIVRDAAGTADPAGREAGTANPGTSQGAVASPAAPNPVAATFWRADPRPTLGRWLAELRARASLGLHRHLPEPQASLAAGVLLGGAGQLDASFRLDLQRSGLAHLLAIDGFKMIVVAATISAVATRLVGPAWATLPIWLTIATYTLLTGAHPSAIRAALMVGLAGAAASFGRPADPLTSLLLATVAMAAVEPPILLDVGLQLSFSATLGLILFWPRLRRSLRRARIRERHLPRAILEPAGLTLAVTVATLPVMLSVFQSISLISPVAHIAAVPLLAPLMVFSMLLALVSPIDALAQPVSWLVWLPATALVDITGTFGGWPNAALSTGRLPTLAALGLAAVLVAWGIAGLPEFRGLRRRWASSCPPLPMRWIAASAALAVAVVLVRPDGQLHVVALDAGQGDALFIRGPTGQTAVLARGRVDSARLASEVAQQLAVWEHKLDIALALDAAAESGMATTLGRYPADRRLTPAEDDRIDLGGGAVLDVYAVVADQAVGSPARPTPAKLILTFREHSEMLFGTSVWPYVSAVA